MLKVFGARIVRLVATLLAVSFLTFMLGVFLPGDPINAILPPDAPRDQATVDRLTEELGLNDPTLVRYGNWLRDAAQGDLGYSYVNDQPVWDTIKQRIPITGELAILATLIALVVALPVGVIGGYKEGKPVDKLSSAGVQVGLSVPSFIVGIFLIWLFTVRQPSGEGPSMILLWLIFAAVAAVALFVLSRPGLEGIGKYTGMATAAAGAVLVALAAFDVFGAMRVALMMFIVGMAIYWAPRPIVDNDDLWKVIASMVFVITLGALAVNVFTSNLDLPSTGWRRISDEGLRANLRTAILPAIALSLSPMAFYTRLLRSDMIGTLKEDYVLSARAKGLTDRYILGRHALRPSSLSLITIIGIQIGILLGGTVVIEQIFALPGLGSRLLNAINQRDILMVQGITVFIATVYVVINTVVDFIYMAIDPRIRKR